MFIIFFLAVVGVIGSTYAAPLETIPSSWATASKSGCFWTLEIGLPRERGTWTYSAIVGVANTDNQELELICGLCLGHVGD